MQGTKVIICFTGMDGTGKTTNARQVYDKLSKDKKRVVYFQVLSGDTFLRKLLGRLTLHIRNKTHKDSYKPNKSGVLRLWPLFSFADACLTYIWLKLLSITKIIIMDRYFYDELAIMTCLDIIKFKTARRIIRLMPRPDMIFLFETSAEIAYERKPEHPLEFFVKQAQFYSNIAPALSAIIINTERLDCFQVSKMIAEKLEERW